MGRGRLEGEEELGAVHGQPGNRVIQVPDERRLECGSEKAMAGGSPEGLVHV